MNQVLFDFLLKYTAWLRGHRTALGLVLYFVAVLFALATGQPATIMAAITAFVGAVLTAVGLRPEEPLPPPIPEEEGEFDWPRAA